MKRAFALAAIGIGLVWTLAASGNDWTRFRGTNGAGVSDATTSPVEFTEQDLNWKLSIPGHGNASPVVWDDRIFVTSADPQSGARMMLSEAEEITWLTDVFDAFVGTSYRPRLIDAGGNNSGGTAVGKSAP